MVKTANLPILLSIKGSLFVAMNYAMTLIIVIVIIKLVSSSRIMNFCLYGKE